MCPGHVYSVRLRVSVESVREACTSPRGETARDPFPLCLFLPGPHNPKAIESITFDTLRHETSCERLVMVSGNGIEVGHGSASC